VAVTVKSTVKHIGNTAYRSPFVKVENSGAGGSVLIDVNSPGVAFCQVKGRVSAVCRPLYAGPLVKCLTSTGRFDKTRVRVEAEVNALVKLDVSRQQECSAGTSFPAVNYIGKIAKLFCVVDQICSAAGYVGIVFQFFRCRSFCCQSQCRQTYNNY